jgi:hypothetical protein
MSDREKQDLLEAFEGRYGIGATVGTAQLPAADSHEYRGGSGTSRAVAGRRYKEAAERASSGDRSVQRHPRLAEIVMPSR